MGKKGHEDPHFLAWRTPEGNGVWIRATSVDGHTFEGVGFNVASDGHLLTFETSPPSNPQIQEEMLRRLFGTLPARAVGYMVVNQQPILNDILS